MGSLFKQTYTKRDTSTGERVKCKSTNWYIKYRDADGIVRKEPGYKDKAATLQLLAERERESELERAGIRDPYKEHRRRPLSEHVADYEQFLQDKGTTANHVATTLQRIRDVIDSQRFVMVDDISPSAMQSHLAKLRDAGRSTSSCNHYLVAMKMLLNWMVRDRRIAENPLRGMSKKNTASDRRHVRRALTADEFAKLLEATATGTTHHRLSPEERVMLYIVATYTGLRRNELASLTANSFDLVADPPTVTVEAKDSKHRKRDILPLKADFAQLVGDWVRRNQIESDSPLFKIKGAKTGEMIRKDLEAAGIESIDSSGMRIDFHSLRQTFITNLSRSNVAPKLTQMLARHSDISLTMNTYTTLGLSDQQQAVESLPAIPSQPFGKPEAIKNLVPILVPTSDFSGPKASFDGIGCHDGGADLADDEDEENPGKTVVFRGYKRMPKEGLEPSLPLQELDFESSASASSATSATLF